MFHENLRELREEAGYSQKEFAAIIKIPVTTYRNYENTLREPSYEILIKICDVLNVSADELLGRDKIHLKNQKIVSKIDRLSTDEKKIIIDFIDFLIERKKNIVKA